MRFSARTVGVAVFAGVIATVASASAPAFAGAAKGHAHAASEVARAEMPGFETLADGATRLTLALSKPVTFATQTAPGKVTYVLKGARLRRRNDRNPLVTVHFNTPVTSARLVPHGHDVLFVLDLRANVQPQVAIDTVKDGTALLRIDLPKGDYLGAPAPASSKP